MAVKVELRLLSRFTCSLACGEGHSCPSALSPSRHNIEFNSISSPHFMSNIAKGMPCSHYQICWGFQYIFQLLGGVFLNKQKEEGQRTRAAGSTSIKAHMLDFSSQFNINEQVFTSDLQFPGQNAFRNQKSLTCTLR